MVTQPQDTSQENLQQTDAALPDDPVIVDETSEEQLAIEAQLDAEAGITPEEPEPVEAETEVAPEPEPQGAQAQQDTGAEPEPEPEAEPQQPQPRVYSAEEVAKMQSAYDRQIAETRRLADERQRIIDERNIEAEVEAAMRRNEAQLAPELGAERARQIARDPQNAAAIRANLESAQKAERLEQQLQQQQVDAERQAQATVAQMFMRDNNLPAEDFEVLMQIPTPNGMQAVARRLAAQAATTQQQNQERQQRVPPETPQTQPTNGRSDGTGAETAEQALERINRLPATEWSDADYEFMRTGRLRS